MSNSDREERRARQFDEWVASELGLTYDELDDQDWAIDDTAAHDGAMHGHTVTFDEGSDEGVLAKISGLQEGRWVRIGFSPDKLSANVA